MDKTYMAWLVHDEEASDIIDDVRNKKIDRLTLILV